MYMRNFGTCLPNACRYIRIPQF